MISDYVPSAPKSTILVGGNIINSSFDGYQKETVLWIQGEKIHRISPTLDGGYPDNSQVLDITGKYVLPGLVDMHAHIMGVAGELELYLGSGVTCVRDVGSIPQKTVPMRDAIAGGHKQGPRVFTYGYLIDGKDPRYPELSRVVRDTEACRAVIEEEASLGVDGIKLLFRLPYELIEFCIREAHSRGLPVAGHFGEVALDSQGVRLGIDSIEHVLPLAKDVVPAQKRTIVDEYGHFLGPFKAWAKEVNLDSEEVSSTIELFKTSKTLLVPTLTVFDKLSRLNNRDEREDPNLALVPTEMTSLWEAYNYVGMHNSEDVDMVRTGFEKSLRFVKLFYDEVGRIGVGTDTPNPFVIPGISLHRELELLADAGISESELLKNATLGAAEFLGVQSSTGTVAAAKNADLLILDEDPLKDISNTRRIHLVFSRGRAVQPVYIS